MAAAAEYAVISYALHYDVLHDGYGTINTHEVSYYKLEYNITGGCYEVDIIIYHIKLLMNILIIVWYERKFICVASFQKPYACR